MGFVGILQLAARSLDNIGFLSWLMDRFNSENMMVEIGGKWIEDAIKCVLNLPCNGGTHLCYLMTQERRS
jgi:hypothetical protein